jgi:hypothetical protein
MANEAMDTRRGLEKIQWVARPTGCLPISRSRTTVKVSPHLESITLSFADVLAKRNALVRHVYFPTSGLIALRTATIGRPSLAVIGSEGMVGSSVAAGVAMSEALVVVQSEGAAMRVNAGRFRLAGGAKPDVAAPSAPLHHRSAEAGVRRT